MPRPFATKSGSFYLNVKVRKALRDTARGRTVTLPVGDSHATVTLTDKVFVSLRTKYPETAKTRFRLAMHALDQYFEAVEAIELLTQAHGPNENVRAKD